MTAERAGPGGVVHAFEPGPWEFTQLRENVALNHLTNVMLNHVAVSADNGHAMLTICVGGAAFNTLGRLSHPGVGAEVPRYTIRVPTVTLDSYIKDCQLSRIDLVKVDVEGAELMVLQGARELLGRTPAPVWIIEVTDATTAGFGYPAKCICDFLSSNGYNVWGIDRATRELHPWV